jgi:hypothetical protein
MGFAISGASTVAASDARAIMYQNVFTGGSPQAQYGSPYLVTGLTAGSTTFKLKYRAAGGGTAGTHWPGTPDTQLVPALS